MTENQEWTPKQEADFELKQMKQDRIDNAAAAQKVANGEGGLVSITPPSKEQQVVIPVLPKKPSA